MSKKMEPNTEERASERNTTRLVSRLRLTEVMVYSSHLIQLNLSCRQVRIRIIGCEK